MKGIAAGLLGAVTAGNGMLFIFAMAIQNDGLEFPLTYFTRTVFAFVLMVLVDKE